MPKNINLKGTAGNTYNLDELVISNTRLDSNLELLVQIWEWNPDLAETNEHHFPNPKNPKVGQIWLSKRIDYTSAIEKYGGDTDGNTTK